MKRIGFLLMLVVGITKNFNAQPVTEDTDIVSGGDLQLEADVKFEYMKTHKNFLLPEMLMRYGLPNGLELRFATAMESDLQANNRLRNLELGLKIRILNFNSTQLALVNHLTVPAQLKKINKTTLASDVGLIFNQNIDKRLRFAGAVFHSFNDTHADDFRYSLMMGYHLKKDLEIYFEGYNKFFNGKLNNILLAGFTYDVTTRLQWETAVSHNFDGQYTAVSTGIVWYLNFKN
jgi:hypothetical protein